MLKCTHTLQHVCVYTCWSVIQVSYLFWCIRSPHHRFFVQRGHRPDTNPPLMSQASQEKHWHFALRHLPFLLPRTDGTQLRWDALSSRPWWDEGLDSDDWWIIWDLTGDWDTAFWDKNSGGMWPKIRPRHRRRNDLGLVSQVRTKGKLPTAGYIKHFWHTAYFIVFMFTYFQIDLRLFYIVVSIVCKKFLWWLLKENVK